MSLQTQGFHLKFKRQITREKRWRGGKQTRGLENSFSFFFSPHETTSAEKKNIDRQGVPANVTKHWVERRILKSRKLELCLPVHLPERIEIVSVWDSLSEAEILTCLWCSANLLWWPSSLRNMCLRAIRILPKNTEKKN